MAGARLAEIDTLFARATIWRAETDLIRDILHDTALVEDVKWGKACYRAAGGNICIIYRMKSCCGLGFFKGELLSDPMGMLVSPGPNSRAAKQFRFTSLDDIKTHSDTIRAYVNEAIALETSGAKVDFDAAPETPMPDEMKRALEADPELFDAYEALTPGRKRSWIIHVAGAKQSATRTSRITKAKPLILKGKGMNGR